MRNIVSFNDNWKFIKNAADEVEAAKGEGRALLSHIPGMRLTDRMAEMIIIVEPAGMLKNLQNRKRMKQIKPISNFVELQ